MTSGLWLATALVVIVLAAIYYFGRQMVKASQKDALEDENDLRNKARDDRNDLRTSDDDLDELRKP